MAPSTPDGALAARTVLLLVGGTSPERGVSLESGRALAEALETLQRQGSIAGYRRIEIEADGSAELQLSGAEFFRAIWIDAS